MKINKNVSIGVLFAGVFILVVSVLADQIGIGGGGAFGSRQLMGTIGGAILTVAGLVLTFRQS